MLSVSLFAPTCMASDCMLPTRLEYPLHRRGPVGTCRPKCDASAPTVGWEETEVSAEAQRPGSYATFSDNLFAHVRMDRRLQKSGWVRTVASAIVALLALIASACPAAAQELVG